MKNKIKLIGIIAFAAVIGLLLASCADNAKGGTLEIKNNTSGKIVAFAGSQSDVTAKRVELAAAMLPGGTPPNDYIIEKGATKKYSFDENGEVHYFWMGMESSNAASIKPTATITIENGKAESLEAE